MSPWWADTLGAFLRSGRRQLVARVGRRGGKSSSLCRLAVALALYGGHDVPPGDIGWVCFVSVSRDEASARLRTICAILDALGVPYAPAGDGAITIQGRPIGFKVLTGSVAGVSGWTSIAVIADELAKWVDRQTLTNPATEVLAALRPTMATQPNARIILSSSPVSDDDAHARAFDEGDTDFQTVAHAATWAANPTISEADTHALEPDERVWKREYAAIPQAAVLDGYLADVVAQCVDNRRKGPTQEPRPGVHYVVSLDPALRRDEFALAVLRCELNAERLPVVIVETVMGWRAAQGQVLSVEATVERVAEVCRRFGASVAYSDQYCVDVLAVLLSRHGIGLVGVPWTASNKAAKFRAFRALCMDRRVRIVDEPQTVAQLESICIKLTPSGTESYEGRGNDDRAFAVVLGALEAMRMPSNPAGTPDDVDHADDAARTFVRRAYPLSAQLAAADASDDFDAEEISSGIAAYLSGAERTPIQ